MIHCLYRPQSEAIQRKWMKVAQYFNSVHFKVDEVYGPLWPYLALYEVTTLLKEVP